MLIFQAFSVAIERKCIICTTVYYKRREDAEISRCVTLLHFLLGNYVKKLTIARIKANDPIHSAMKTRVLLARVEI